jgi:hypothetical protein
MAWLYVVLSVVTGIGGRAKTLGRWLVQNRDMIVKLLDNLPLTLLLHRDPHKRFLVTALAGLVKN